MYGWGFLRLSEICGVFLFVCFGSPDPQVENRCYSQGSQIRRVHEESVVLPKPGSASWDSETRLLLQLSGCVALQASSEGMHVSPSHPRAWTLYFKQECVVLQTTERICAAFGERQQLRTPHWFWMKFNAGQPNRHDREFGRSLKRLRVIGQTLPLPKQAGALR